MGRDFGEAELAAFRGPRRSTSRGSSAWTGETFHWQGKYSLRPQLARHHLHRPQRLRVLQAQDPDALPRAPATSSSATSIRCCSATCWTRWTRPRIVACDTMNFWIAGKPEELRETLAAGRRAAGQRRRGPRAVRESGTSSRPPAPSARMGPRTLVVKKGEHGVLMFSDEGSFAAPAYPARRGLRPDGRRRHVRRRVPGLPGRLGGHGRRRAASGGRHGQHARVVLRRGLQSRPTAAAHPPGDRRSLPALQAAHHFDAA